MDGESKLSSTVLLILTTLNIFLMIAIAGLFVRMNRLQSAVLTVLTPSQPGPMVDEIEMGLKAGSQAPLFILPDTIGRTISPDSPDDRKTLLVFFSHQCPACVATLAHLKTFTRDEKEVRVIIMAKGSSEQNRRLAAELGDRVPILSWKDTLVEDYEVPFTPFVYVIDANGIITSGGPANTLEDLKILVQAN